MSSGPAWASVVVAATPKAPAATVGSLYWPCLQVLEAINVVLAGSGFTVVVGMVRASGYVVIIIAVTVRVYWPLLVEMS